MAEKKENNFLVKIDKVRKKSYAGFMLLKQDDIIVALNNQFYTFGETKLTEELKDLKVLGFENFIFLRTIKGKSLKTILEMALSGT